MAACLSLAFLSSCPTQCTPMASPNALYELLILVKNNSNNSNNVHRKPMEEKRERSLWRSIRGPLATLSLWEPPLTSAVSHWPSLFLLLWQTTQQKAAAAIMPYAVPLPFAPIPPASLLAIHLHCKLFPYIYIAPSFCWDPISALISNERVR